MKKAFFAGIAVLAALVMMTCDLFPSIETGGNNNIVYDEDGTPLVNLTIKTGDTASRALSEALAKDWVNYYEVAFKYNDKIYRARWRKGTIGRIAVPYGTYNTVDPAGISATTVPDGPAKIGAAIMFAGRYETRSLLAVGNLAFTSEANGTQNGFIIDEDTVSVTFELTALKIDIDVTAPNATPSSSSFEITETGYETASILAANFPKVKFVTATGVDYIPMFVVKTDLGSYTWTNSTATVSAASSTTNVTVNNSSLFSAGDVISTSITGTPSATVIAIVDATNITVNPALPVTTTDTIYKRSANPTAATDTTNDATYTIVEDVTSPSGFPYAAGVFVQTPKLDTDSVYVESPSTSGFALKAATISWGTTNTANAPMPANGKFDLVLTVPADKTGLSWLAIDIPVTAMAQTKDINGDIWHIHGGLKNAEYDLSAAVDSLGGAILLGANVLNFADIEIFSQWP